MIATSKVTGLFRTANQPKENIRPYSELRQKSKQASKDMSLEIKLNEIDEEVKKV